MSTFRSADERAGAVAELAYRLWEERGCPEGSPEDDWYKAELMIEREQDDEGGKAKSLNTPPGRTRRKAR